MGLFIARAYSFNPREVFCPICKHIIPDTVLMVGDDHSLVCSHCGLVHLGGTHDGTCAKCGCNKLKDCGSPPADTKFPGPEPCHQCAEQISKAEAVVVLGGLAWRCVDCGSIGAFSKENPKVAEFQERFPNQERYWQLDQANCPICQESSGIQKNPVDAVSSMGENPIRTVSQQIPSP